MTDIILVSMPFASIYRASVGLSTLTSILKNNYIDAKVLYGNLTFAKHISLELYEDMCQIPFKTLLGEGIFSSHAYSSTSYQDKNLLNLFENGQIVLLPSKKKLTIEDYMKVKNSVEDYLSKLTEMILKRKPKIVGFSSLFQQTCASVAIANILKIANPEIVTVLGGSNCMKPMGESLLKITPSIDYVFSGEADFDFNKFCMNILKGNHPENKFIICAPVEDLNKLPYPDYSDYFEQIKGIGYTGNIWIGFEGSRGCWWGQKSHCLFCGLNGETLKYRQKKTRRIEDEIQHIVCEYGVGFLQATDNIMPRDFSSGKSAQLKYFKKLKGIYYELRPIFHFNELLDLKDKGIKYIQPGIETLNTRILKLMRKALFASDNIRFLRDCKTIDIYADWNILHSIPGERAKDYVEMLGLIPYLYHLPPPMHAGPLCIQRFSPLYDEAYKYKIKNIRPLKIYSDIFPENANFRDLAHFFDGDYKVAFENQGLKESFMSIITQWQALWREKPPSLMLGKLNDRHYLVEDTRPISTFRFQIITRRHFSVLKRCREPVRESEMQRVLKNEELDDIFAELMSWGYIIRLDKKYLSLVNEPMRVKDIGRGTAIE